MKNSFGYDEICSRIIEATAPFIIPLLTYICDMMLDTGVFPDRLKFAIVKPCFKKGNIHEISNYRPILLLTSFSEIKERLIYARIITHILANCIFAEEQ
jgi:hypothetical protein